MSNVAQLDSVLIRYQDGSSLEIEFFRESTSSTVTVTLGERPG